MSGSILEELRGIAGGTAGTHRLGCSWVGRWCPGQFWVWLARGITSGVRGALTPSTRVSSMSLVALGPLMMVSGRVPSRRAILSGRRGDRVDAEDAQVV